MLPRIEPGLIGPNNLLIKSRESSGVARGSSFLSVDDDCELFMLRKGSVDVLDVLFSFSFWGRFFDGRCCCSLRFDIVGMDFERV